MRKVPREPEELQLERQRERIERSPAAQAGRQGVEHRQVPGHRLERPLVPLLLDEQPEHGLRTHEPDRQPVRVLARRSMRIDERCAGDRVQLARALMQHQLHVRERLEPRAEARLRLAHALRDRADPPRSAV